MSKKIDLDSSANTVIKDYAEQSEINITLGELFGVLIEKYLLEVAAGYSGTIYYVYLKKFIESVTVGFRFTKTPVVFKKVTCRHLLHHFLYRFYFVYNQLHEKGTRVTSLCTGCMYEAVDTKGINFGKAFKFRLRNPVQNTFCLPVGVLKIGRVDKFTICLSAPESTYLQAKFNPRSRFLVYPPSIKPLASMLLDPEMARIWDANDISILEKYFKSSPEEFIKEISLEEIKDKLHI